MVAIEWPFKVLDAVLCEITEVPVFCLLSRLIEVCNDIEADVVEKKWMTLVVVLLDEVADVSCDVVVEDSSARELDDLRPWIPVAKVTVDFLEVTVNDSTPIILEVVTRLLDVERLERSSVVMKKDEEKKERDKKGSNDTFLYESFFWCHCLHFVA